MIRMHLHLLFNSFNSSYYNEALVKSLYFCTDAYSRTGNHITYNDMKKHKHANNAFLACSYRIGTHTGSSNMSFGRPYCFFRLNFTSACVDTPTAMVDWVQYQCQDEGRSSCTGTMSINEWETGPKSPTDCNPFLSLDDIRPSRYALTYAKQLRRQQILMKVTFLALDPERIGDGVDDDMFQDFGDNILTQYLRKGNDVRDDTNADDYNISNSSSESTDDDASGSSRDSSELSDDSTKKITEKQRLQQRTLLKLFSPSVLRYLQYKDEQ